MTTAAMLKPVDVRKLTPSIVIRLPRARGVWARETMTASNSAMPNTIIIRFMNGMAFSASEPPMLAGNQKIRLITTDAIAPTSAPPSVARGQNKPSRKITVMPGVTKPENS